MLDLVINCFLRNSVPDNCHCNQLFILDTFQLNNVQTEFDAWLTTQKSKILSPTKYTTSYTNKPRAP